MKATYFAPGVEPRIYDYQLGEKPGTVDLLNAKGRVIVSGLPFVREGEETSGKCYAVLPGVEVTEKVKSPRAPRAPKPAPEVLMPSEVETTPVVNEEAAE